MDRGPPLADMEGMLMAERTDPTKIQTALRLELAKAVAGREFPDDVVASVTKQLVFAHEKWPIHRIDVCVYGICIDRFVPVDRYREVLEVLLTDDLPIRKVELFPWGIIDWDIVQIRVEQKIPELAGLTRGH
ncbi:hypothetical protein BH20ACT7_BH20ACT7_05780 [soil metagenome]